MSTQQNGRALFKSGTIVTMDQKVPNLPIGDVLVDGGRIAAVGPNLLADGADVIDAAGCIVMPGLIDAHHHHMWLLPANRGSAMGAFVAFLDIAYGVSAPVAGVIASQFGYAAVYLFGAACALLGATLVVTARSSQP